MADVFDAIAASEPFGPSGAPSGGTAPTDDWIANSIPLGGKLPAADAPRPSLLSRSWQSLSDAAHYVGSEIANPTPATEAEGGPGVGKELSEGVVRGIADEVHPPVAWLARQFGNDEPTKRTEQWRKDFEDKYGDSTAASIGRVAGQTVATVPVLAAGGAMAQAAARAVPVIAPAVTFLGGGGTAARDAGLAARLLMRTGSLGSQGAITGAATGAMTAGDQSTGDAALQGAATGAVGAPIIGAALSQVARAVSLLRGNLPNMVERDLAGWAQNAKDYGIDIDPSQLTTNKTFQIIADQTGKLPFSGASESIMNARRQAQQAIAKQMGSDAPNGITFDVMDNTRRRISAVFDREIPNASINANGPGFLNGLANVEQEALTAFNGDRTAPEFQKIMGKINQLQDLAAAGNGTISGEAAQTYLKTNSPFDRALRGDPSSTVQSYLRDIKDVVNANLEGRTPEGQAALDEAKRHWRVMKTIEPLVEQKGASGDINLSGLKQQVINQSRKFDQLGYAYGSGGPLRDLGEIGQRFFASQPETGSGARGVTLGALAGGGIGAALSHPSVPIGIAASLAANRYALQPFIRSPTVGANMIRGTLSPNYEPTVQRAIPYAMPGLLNIGQQ